MDYNIDLTPLEPILAAESSHKGGLIAVLQQTQAIYGYLPQEAIILISDKLNIKTAKIMGVATFYTQFRMTPAGKFLIQLCQGTACHVNGSAAIEEAVTEILGVTNGQTTQDGLFTLHNVACLGCCSLSPVMMINGEPYGSLTPEKAKQILGAIRESEVKL